MSEKPDKHNEYFSKSAFESYAEALKNAIIHFDQWQFVQEEMKDLNRTLVMNPADTGKLRDSIQYFGVDPADKDSDKTMLLGMDVVESPYIEQGTAYLVKKPHINFEMTIPDGFDMRAFERSISEAIFASFGIPPRYFEQPVIAPKYHRRDKETIIQWGNRLEKMGLLDNPAIRWEYQKEVLKTVFVVPVQVLIEFVKERVLHE